MFMELHMQTNKKPLKKSILEQLPETIYREVANIDLQKNNDSNEN